MMPVQEAYFALLGDNPTLFHVFCRMRRLESTFFYLSGGTRRLGKRPAQDNLIDAKGPAEPRDRDSSARPP